MTNLRFSTAQQLVDAFPVLRDELGPRNLGMAPFAYIDSLLDETQARKALAFCALLLPRRESVHWLCRALRAATPSPSAGDDNLLKLAEDWVKAPTETARRAALDAGMADPGKGASAWAALAAGWSGGNMSSSVEQPVPPPAHLTGHAVKVGFSMLAAPLPLPQQYARIEEFVRDAVLILKTG